MAFNLHEDIDSKGSVAGALSRSMKPASQMDLSLRVQEAQANIAENNGLGVGTNATRDGPWFQGKPLTIAKLTPKQTTKCTVLFELVDLDMNGDMSFDELTAGILFVCGALSSSLWVQTWLYKYIESGCSDWHISGCRGF